MLVRYCTRVLQSCVVWQSSQTRRLYHLLPNVQRLLLPQLASLDIYGHKFSTSIACCKKLKDKTAKTKHISLSLEEAAPVLNMEEYRQELQKVYDELKHDYLHTLALRTSTATFDRLPIKTKKAGTIPLNQIASIVQKTPSLLIINLSNSSEYMADVMDALRSSGMNLNPQQEGLTIFIQIPKVSREQREALAKSAKVLFNNAKTAMSKVHSNSLKKVNKQKKGGGISTDIIHGVENKILEEMQEKVKEAEAMMKAKQKELLQES